MEESFIKALLFDIDGSIMPQGGPAAANVIEFFRGLSALNLPMGPCTGKNADYGRGIGCGMGTHWHFVSAESGAQFLECTFRGTPPAYKQRKLEISLKALKVFSEKINLNPFERTFMFRDELVSYRPELKEGIITIFPPGTDLDITLPWVDYFNEIRITHRLGLKIQRHSDGCIDIVPLQVSKTMGIIEVCSLYRCGPENIIVVVDGVNDLELAQGTTVIAVNNANAQIKEAAMARKEFGYIAEKNDGQGFIEGMKHFANKGFLGQRSRTIAKLATACLKINK